jgi:DNA-binding NarL/FixJ family response regulator
MKRNTSHWHNNFNAIADEETAVPSLQKNPKPYNGDSTVRQQIEQLTFREIEVLQFVAEGKLNKQAASELCVSIKTIEKHREHITKKLGIRGIAALTHFAIYNGIIKCNPQLALA